MNFLTFFIAGETGMFFAARTAKALSGKYGLRKVKGAKIYFKEFANGGN